MWFIRRLKGWWESWKREEAEFDAFGRALDQLLEEYESEIEPLEMEEARLRAERLLSDPGRFRCTLAAERNWGVLDELAPLAQEFFRTYDEVLQLPGDLILARAVIKPSTVDPEMLVIGSSGEEHTHLALRPGEEMVSELDEEIPDKPPHLRFPSVYHCILYYDRYQALLLPQ